MKKIVAYYTRNGNSAVVSKVISDELNCDILELTESKKRSNNIFGFIKAGFDAATGKKSKLTIDTKSKFANYDEIILVSPVWASTFAPAINTVLHDIDMKDKTISLIACQADKGLGAKDNIKSKLESIITPKGGKLEKCECIHGNAPGKEPFSLEHYKGIVSDMLNL